MLLTQYFCHIPLGDEHEMEDKVAGEEGEDVRASHPLSEHFQAGSSLEEVTLHSHNIILVN